MDFQSCNKLTGGSKLWFLVLILGWGYVGIFIVYKGTSHFNECFLVLITNAAIQKGQKYLLHI